MHPRSAFWGPAARVARTEGTGTVSFTQCHFDSWDCHFDGKKDYTHNGTACIDQAGGTLILSMNEFTGGSATAAHARTHVEVGAAASKTIVTGNVITGTLGIKREGKAGKVAVANNLDDSPADEEF
jgi:hypothetical protein